MSQQNSPTMIAGAIVVACLLIGSAVVLGPHLSGLWTKALGKGVRPSPLDCTTETGACAADVGKAQEACAEYLGRKVEEEDEIAPGVKMKFALVPPGRLLMGSPQSERDYVKTFGPAPGDWAKDETLHEVGITRRFYMGVYDVTQNQWEAVTGSNPRAHAP